MQEYFILQIKMMTRKLIEFGIQPLLALFLLLIVFVISTYILFEKSSYAAPVYTVVAMSLLLKTDSIERNSFLKQVFRKKDFYWIRIIENGVIMLPFLVVLIFRMEYIFASLLFIIGNLMAFVSLNRVQSFVLPTPFYKRPFEFIIGLRTWFYLLVLGYFFVAMALKHDNYNLGLFAVILLFLLFISFYTKPENEYFIWNFSLSSGKFLYKKMIHALFHATPLIFPIYLVIVFMFPENLMNTHLFLALSYIFLFTSILAKYASYPYEMQLPYMILLVISVFFPPLLLFLIPFLFWKATQHLNEYLL